MSGGLPRYNWDEKNRTLNENVELSKIAQDNALLCLTSPNKKTMSFNKTNTDIQQI